MYSSLSTQLKVQYVLSISSDSLVVFRSELALVQARKENKSNSS